METKPEDSITLCIVRHGESVHNVAERYGIDTRSNLDYYDPRLTEKGCVDVQEELHPTCDFTDGFSVWVSPLRRTLETAVLSLPEVNDFCVVETLREIAGLKTADARRGRGEITAWLKEEYPQKRFDLSQIWGDEDPYQKVTERETAADITERVIASLELLLSAGHKNVIWVSHSAFLSCLMAYLFLPNGNPEARWLRNGEWRIIDLPVTKLQQHLRQWPSTIGRNAGALSNTVWPFKPGSDWGIRALELEPLSAPLLSSDLLTPLHDELTAIATFPPRTEIYSVESIAALVFGAKLRSRSPHRHVIVLGHPFRQKDEPAAPVQEDTTLPSTPKGESLSPVESAVPSLARTSSGAVINANPVLMAACNQVVAHLRTECDISLEVESTPSRVHGEDLLVHHGHGPVSNRVPEHVLGEASKPWIYKTEGYSRVSLMSNNTIHSTKLGVQTRAHVLLICHPNNQQGPYDSTRVCERAPFWCTRAYLTRLAQDLSLLPNALCPLSITVIMPFST